MSDTHDIDAVEEAFRVRQDAICEALERADGSAVFRRDPWAREQGGGGETRVLAGGAVFERAGVNFSRVRGDRLPAAATERRPDLAGREFQAMGVSVVIHPMNPYVPTAHANFRFFIAGADRGEARWWFGGGMDLTPYYGFEDDVRDWHRTLADFCAPYGEEVYPHFKRWCDEYFHLRHRGEARGVGGLFYDDLHEWGFASSFGFSRGLADCFVDAYLPIVERRKEAVYGERERDFQLYRRGRYVEFNLLYDRGTIFGLQTGGRTESILMSMPPEVRWRYDWRPEPGSPEARLYERFLQPRDWI